MDNKKYNKIYIKVLKEFIEALKYEINAIQSAPQSQAFKITNGMCKETTSKTYFFRNPSSLDFREDEQVTILIDSKKYEGQIKDCNEESLFVSISSESPDKFSEKIKEAYIKSDRSFLLISLKEIFLSYEKKLIGQEGNEVDVEKIIPDFNFKRASQILGELDINNNEEKENIVTKKNPLSFLNDIVSDKVESVLNKEQKSFIDFSKKENIVYLWGPPGTGKSYAIAALAKLFFQDNKKILLISNTNNAVDLLLKTFCDSVKDSEEFKKGHVIKDGDIFNDELEDKFGSYVNKKKIEEKIRSSFIPELDLLLTKEQDLEKTLAKIKTDQIETKILYYQIKNKKKLILPYSELFYQKLNSEEKHVKIKLESENSQIIKIKKQQNKDESKIINLRKSIEKAIQNWKDNISVTASTAYSSVLKYSNQSKDSYDIVIIDEVSMLPLPYVYFFSGLSKDKVILAGDFMQISPIATTKKNHEKSYEHVEKWFKKDIFSTAGIVSSLKKKIQHKSLKQFKTQYRMDNKICQVVNNFYDGMLVTSETIKKTEKSIYFVNTGILEPICTEQSIHSYSKFNYIHALAIVNYIQYLKFEHPEKIKNKKYLGVITPYKSQATLIKRLLEDKNINTVTVGTINSFQGAERDMIIFDTTESPNFSKMPVFTAPFEDTKFNVAISRAKNKLIVFANHPWFKNEVIEAKDYLGIPKLTQKVKNAYDDIYRESSKLNINNFFLTAENPDPTIHPAQAMKNNNVVMHYEKDKKDLQMNLAKTEKYQKQIERDRKNKKSKKKQKEIVEMEINFIDAQRQIKTLEKQLKLLEEDKKNMKNKELDYEYLLNKDSILPKLTQDIESAKDLILIYAAFYTESMIDYWKPILEKKIKAGVKIKCFARKPSFKSTEKFSNIEKLIDIGVIVDFEEGQHIKDVYIDFKILYTGSANILSFTDKTKENFRRITNTSSIRQKIMLPYPSKKTPETILLKQYKDCKKCGSPTYKSKKQKIECIKKCK